MGKSEAAKGISKLLNTLYIDLSKIHVGNGTLIGELTRALDVMPLQEFRDQVRNGTATLVLDSTDEAQLRSGFENFSQFLKDLDWFIDSSVRGPRIVLLGRSDSISLTEIALKLIDRPAPVIELQPLGFQQSTSFIDTTLSASSYELHRTHSEPFARLRDAVLANLAESLTGQSISSVELPSQWEGTESFLGYPPVLLALAERLKVENPQLEHAQLAASTTSSSRRHGGDLLKGVVEYILDRESAKVRESIGESLGILPLGTEARSLYTRDEQAARLLRHTGTNGVVLDRPAVLPEHDRVRYEEQIQGFVPDHPFVRGNAFSNPVFSDYMRAWAITSPVSELFTDNRSSFLSSLPPVGPFFARFLAALTTPGSEAEIPEDLVDDAIKSHFSGSSVARAFYQHSEGHDDGHLRLLDETPRLRDHDLNFRVVEAGGVLNVTGPLGRVVIVSDFGVILRSGSTDQLELGPDTVVIAHEIEIAAKVLRAVSSAESGGSSSVVIARDGVSHDRDLRVVTYGPRDLVISWPDPWHQWNPYMVSASMSMGRHISRQLMTQVVVAVRKILLSFRSSSRDAPAVSADKVDRILVGGNEVAESVRDGLLELGAIEHSGTQYRLGLNRLSELGISWGDVSSDDPFESLAGLCEKVISTQAFSSKELR